MKKIIQISALLIALVLCLGLVACSSYGKIEKALTDNEYKVVEKDAVANSIESENSKEDNGLKIHCFYKTKKLTTVYVLEVKSTDEMKELIDDSDTIKGLISDIKNDGTAEEIYKALEEKGLVNGNCLVIAVGLDALNVYEIIKGL